MASSETHSPSEKETRDCLNLISQGDQAAFTKLLRLFWNKVYIQALTYLKSSEVAQEITQDIFLKIWSMKEKLPGLDNFSNYLFIISRNEIISALRKKGASFSNHADEPVENLLRPDLQLNYK